MEDNSASEPLLVKTESRQAPATESPNEPKRSCLATIAQSPRLLWDNGTLCVLVAAALFSIMLVAVKMLGHCVPIFQVVLARSMFSLLLTVWWLRSSGVKPLFGKRYPLLMLRGALGAIGMCLHIFSIPNLKLADAVTIFFSNPAWTALLEWLILGESLGWMGSISSLACLVGVVLVADPPFISGEEQSEWDLQHVLGVCYALGGAWFIAASFISVRFLGESEPALIIALWYHLVSCIASGLPLLFSWPSPAVMPDNHEWTLLFGVAFTSFLGQLLLNRGFQLESATKGAAMNVTQVVYSYMWDLLLFHHQVTAQGLCGGLLIMASVIFLAKRHSAHKPPHQPVQDKSAVLQPDTDTLDTTPYTPIHNNSHLDTRTPHILTRWSSPQIVDEEALVVSAVQR